MTTFWTLIGPAWMFLRWFTDPDIDRDDETWNLRDNGMEG